MAKAIMDKTRQMDSGQVAKPKQSLQVENFDMPQAKYNIPSEMMESVPQMPVSSLPKANMGVGFNKPSVDAIKKSRLPDEIKRLMIEHPIEQPGSMAGPTLSDDLIERASRLMGTKQPVTETKQPTQTNNGDLKEMLKEVVREILSENGLIAESSEKASDLFTFRVGKHVFEGKLTKIKKIR